jgi:hypothetical protein
MYIARTRMRTHLLGSIWSPVCGSVAAQEMLSCMHTQRNKNRQVRIRCHSLFTIYIYYLIYDRYTGDRKKEKPKNIRF